MRLGNMKDHGIFIGILSIILLISVMSGCVVNPAGNLSNNTSPTPISWPDSDTGNKSAQQAVSTASNSSPSHIFLYQSGNPDTLNPITIFARVTDALYRPVGDGTEVMFAINQTPWSLETNGSL